MKKGLQISGHQIIASMGEQDIGKYFSGAVDKSTLEGWIGRETENHIQFRRYMQDVNKEQRGGFYDSLLGKKAFLETEKGDFTFDIPVDNFTEVHTTADLSSQHNAGIGGDTAFIELNREFKEGQTLAPSVNSNISIVIMGEASNTGSGFRHEFKVVGSEYDSVPSRYLQQNQTWEPITHGSSEFGTIFAKPDLGDAPESARARFYLASVTGVEAKVTDDAYRQSIDAESGANLLDRVEDFKRRNSLDDFLVRMDLKVKEGKTVTQRDTANIGTLLEALVHTTVEQMLVRRILFQKAGQVRDKNGIIRFNDGLIPQLKRAFRIGYGRTITLKHIRDGSDHLYKGIDIDKDSRRIKIVAAEQAYNILLQTFERYIDLALERNARLLGADALVKDVVTKKGSGNMNLHYSSVRFTSMEVPGIGHVTLELDRSIGRELEGNRMSRDFRTDNRSESSYYAILQRDDNTRTVETVMPTGTKLVSGGDDSSSAYIVKRRGPLITYGAIHGRMNSHYIPGGRVDAAYKERSMEFWAYGTADLFIPFPEDIVLLHKNTGRI